MKSNLIFIIFFNLLLFLTFLFGDSFIGLYSIGLFSAFLLFFRKKIDFHLFNFTDLSNKREKKSKLSHKVDNSFHFLGIDCIGRHTIIIFSWSIFLLYLLISLFFSYSIPHSLNKLTFYFFSGSFFIFFLFLNKNFLAQIKDLLLNSLILQAINLTLISWVLFFKSDLANLLPSMNLIYSSFGHNHLSALLILVLPISWYYFFENNKISQSIATTKTDYFSSKNLWIGSKNYYFFTSFFLTVSLLLSFGRTTIFLGFLQFLIILYFNFKQNNFLSKKKLLFILFLFLSLISILLFSSLNKDYSDYKKCPTQFFSRQVCKPIHYESRPAYWSVAYEAIKNYPVLGYGLGTFEFISNKYKQNFWEGTGFAHNSFLQFFAETGLIGGFLFMFLMLSMFYFSYKSTFHHQKDNLLSIQLISKKQILNVYLLLSVSAIFLNSLMDFDWNFLSIFLITNLLLALMIREGGNSNNIKFVYEKIVSIFWYFLITILVFLSLLYLAVDALLVLKKYDTAFLFFPYFQYHQIVFSNNLSEFGKNKDKLVNIYKFDSKFIAYEMRKKYADIDFGTLTSLERKKYYENMDQYCLIYPISCQFWQEEIAIQVQKKADYHLSEGRLDLAEKNLQELKSIKKDGYWELQQLGNYYWRLGNFEEAISEFEFCATEYEQQNNGQKNQDCLRNKEIIESGNPENQYGENIFGLDRYQQVSKIITKEAKWQDFLFD